MGHTMSQLIQIFKEEYARQRMRDESKALLEALDFPAGEPEEVDPVDAWTDAAYERAITPPSLDTEQAQLDDFERLRRKYKRTFRALETQIEYLLQICRINKVEIGEVLAWLTEQVKEKTRLPDRS